MSNIEDKNDVEESWDEADIPQPKPIDETMKKDSRRYDEASWDLSIFDLDDGQRFIVKGEGINYNSRSLRILGGTRWPGPPNGPCWAFYLQARNTVEEWLDDLNNDRKMPDFPTPYNPSFNRDTPKIRNRQSPPNKKQFGKVMIHKNKTIVSPNDVSKATKDYQVVKGKGDTYFQIQRPKIEMSVTVRCSDTNSGRLTKCSNGNNSDQEVDDFVSKIIRTEHSGDDNVIAAYMSSEDSCKETKLWIKHAKWQIQGMTSDHLVCFNQ